MEQLQNVPLSLIDESPWQGRLLSTQPSTSTDINPYEVKAMDELIRSIELNGLMQPITLRANGTRYELIDGHRRLLAHRKLGLTQISAIVKEYTDREAQVLTVVANLQRKNLRTIELALGFEKILEAGLFADRKELSNAIGKDETYVNDVINTLNMSPRIVQHLSQTNAVRDVRVLRMIRKAAPATSTQGEVQQWELYSITVEKGFNRQQLAQYLSSKNPKPATKSSWQISFRQRQVDVKIKTGKLNPEKEKQIQMLLNQKLEELINDIL